MSINFKIFARKNGGQFAPDLGGQFHRILQHTHNIQVGIVISNKGFLDSAAVNSNFVTSPFFWENPVLPLILTNFTPTQSIEILQLEIFFL